MKNLLPLLLLPALAALPLALGVALSACDTEDPTTAVIDNDYPAVDPDGGDPAMQTVVYKVWWSSSIFPDPVPGGTESDTSRVVTGADYAYALLAPGWDPASTDPPAILLPVKTRDPLFVTRGGTLHIHVSGATVVGDCATAASGPLTQDDADFITERLFPGDFAAGTYDAKTCSLTPRTADGGTERDAGDAGDSAVGAGTNDARDD